VKPHGGGLSALRRVLYILIGKHIIRLNPRNPDKIKGLLVWRYSFSNDNAVKKGEKFTVSIS
jgi:hypothetical protein